MVVVLLTSCLVSVVSKLFFINISNANYYCLIIADEQPHLIVEAMTKLFHKGAVIKTIM